MSLRLRRVALKGFRKFREPVVIDGLTDGLNIIIEPNETGKSTFLEALRAAFFVRYNAKSQLAQSYAPHGDAVGPEVQVAFEADGASWSVTKRFLRGASVEVTGPQGRAQGEEAEARLNALLGAVRDTSRAGDISTYGALGLLWVAQTEALKVTAPGQIVRDAVTSTLEAEVGSIMGGPAYKRVRDRVDEQFGIYWTPTGQKRGRQNEAHERLDLAEIGARDAHARLAALEKTFLELENTRARLKTVERDIADETDATIRRDLVAALDVARSAAQILATRRAEQEASSARLRGLDDLWHRHEQATALRFKAEAVLIGVREQRNGLANELAAVRKRVTEGRAGLDAARMARQTARTALLAGEVLHRADQRSAAVRAARQRHGLLAELERQYRDAKAISGTLIPADQMTALEACDRAVAEARAAVNAGATRIVFSGPTDGILIDGEPMVAGERTLTKTTTIRAGDAKLLVIPPAAAGSTEEMLASALRKRRSALDELGAEDLGAARARNDAARDATANLRTIEARIQAVTPADPSIDLAVGAEALKLLVSELGDADEDAGRGTPDLTALTRAMEDADDALARAEGAQDSAVDALRRAEERDTPLATVEAGAASDVASAIAQIETIESRTEFAGLVQDLNDARVRAAEASVRLEEATRDATAHDPAAITRKIEIIDARSRTATESRNKLVTDIARLENTVEIEGGAGLADRAAAAQEEVEAARAALQRVTLDADTLKLLRDSLEDARNETSAKFVGPVAARAKRYIERLLPSCELAFTDDLALASVTRAGLPEFCSDLSQGTQEQLSVLTRIAFADMLLEQGRPVSLILDDLLVYSDDARLDVMIEIITDVAQRMQVILLTCRDRAFRHVNANRLTFAHPKSADSPSGAKSEPKVVTLGVLE